MHRVVFCRAYYAKKYKYLFTKKLSEQSYVWIESIFEGLNICLGPEIPGLLESFIS